MLSHQLTCVLHIDLVVATFLLVEFPAPQSVPFLPTKNLFSIIKKIRKYIFPSVFTWRIHSFLISAILVYVSPIIAISKLINITNTRDRNMNSVSWNKKEELMNYKLVIHIRSVALNYMSYCWMICSWYATNKITKIASRNNEKNQNWFWGRVRNYCIICIFFINSCFIIWLKNDIKG